IVGSPQDDETRADGVTVLEGVAWDPVIAIASDEPVNIVIEDLVIRGGSSAISLWLVLSDANVTLTLKNVTFLENGTGLGLGRGTLATCTNCRFEGNDLAVRAQAPDEGARGSFTNCVFEGNGSAISAYGNQTITLDRCVLQNGTDPDGDISLSGSALLEMRDSGLHRAEGRGILLMDTASMTLINNVIETAYSHAIAVASTDASLGPRQDCGVFMGRNDTELPLGTIDGYGNTISGGVCPTSLLFLTEAAPSEVSVALGQSIQWAIDSVADGGVVTIGEGTYRENLDISKPLTLLGIGEVILTPLDQENPAIQVAETSGVVIQELRIETAAIGIETSHASCRISGCWFRATDVGVQAVTMDSDTVRIEDCTFTGETAGVGVLSLGTGRIEITSSDFVALGTGTVLSGATSVLVDACTFKECYDSIVLLSLVQGVLSGNHIDSSRGSGIRVEAVPGSVLDEMRAAAPNGVLDELLVDGPLTLIDNVIQNSMRSGISLCDTKDSEVLTFTGTLLGSGNLIDNMNLLCPVDYDWPEGFFADE
ncbi:right-handed parallel beta-helix repeat-containing protein, partial [Candidatus Bipolaricaulota bacterium]|nr:right-handed parallel beta-helix repeat-containing protein [Candidatus Bipolaricaulota bacterium]